MSSPVEAIEVRLLANPDDAAAWQAYAPWLLEQDDLRGELIALESLADASERRSLDAWVGRERTRWTPEGVAAGDCVWRHGFVVGATMHIAGRSDARTLARLLADPRSRLLSSLRLVFSAEVPSRALASLAAAELGRLRSLRASYHLRGNRVARALTGQSALSLRTLDLRHSGLTDDGLLLLADCGQLRGLRALYLQRNRFTSRGVAALARSPALSGLQVLDLRYNAIGASGAAALAESPHLGALTALHVHAGELDPAGVHALASSTALPHDLVRFWRAQDSPR
jgi:uncharacterized protein (TIGR02996 family)